jgi:hypothetical protein
MYNIDAKYLNKFSKAIQYRPEYVLRAPAG